MTSLTRAHNISVIYDELWVPDQELAELIEEPNRYLLVERYPISKHHYLSTHSSPEEAGIYHTSNEDPGWMVDYLLDLDTGDIFDAVTGITWRKR